MDQSNDILFENYLVTLQNYTELVAINKILKATYSDELVDKAKYELQDALNDYIDKRIENSKQ